jgi:hypothetical protein
MLCLKNRVPPVRNGVASLKAATKTLASAAYTYIKKKREAKNNTHLVRYSLSLVIIIVIIYYAICFGYIDDSYDINHIA